MWIRQTQSREQGRQDEAAKWNIRSLWKIVRIEASGGILISNTAAKALLKTYTRLSPLDLARSSIVI
jgi:hypothetical protein